MSSTVIYRVALGEDRHCTPWRLALQTGAWPRVLIVPTGSGQIAAVTLGGLPTAWATR